MYTGTTAVRQSNHRPEAVTEQKSPAGRHMQKNTGRHFFYLYEDEPFTISRQLESTASTCQASPNPTMGTAECMNSVRSWARVGTAPSGSPAPAFFEPLAITPLPPEICTDSVFAEDATNRTQAGGRWLAPWATGALGRLDRRRLGAPQPRDSERVALLLRVEGRNGQRREAGSGRGIISVFRGKGEPVENTRTFGGRFSCCEKVHRLRPRIEGRGVLSPRARNVVLSMKCLFWDTARWPGQPIWNSHLWEYQARKKQASNRPRAGRLRCDRKKLGQYRWAQSGSSFREASLTPTLGTCN